ncbi:MAG: hypothetical protein Q8R40_03940 [bacterium]|nr:hypothetical protein [bacterium]
MSEEQVRTSFTATYNVNFGNSEYAFMYSDLQCTYREELIAPGRRGYFIVKKYEPKRFAVMDIFGGISIARVIPTPDVVLKSYDKYQLRIILLHNAIKNCGMLDYLALLPHRPHYDPTQIDRDNLRMPGGVMIHLQEILLNHFQVDPINAVLGHDWPSSSTDSDGMTHINTEELWKKMPFIAEEIRKNWKMKTPTVVFGKSQINVRDYGTKTVSFDGSDHPVHCAIKECLENN